MVCSNTLVFGSMVMAALAGCSFSTNASKNGTTGTIPTPDGGFNGDVALVEGGGGGGDINGEACGGNVAMANHLPPDLLIVLDRSGSMNQSSTGANCNGMAGCSKWDQMVAAINQVVAPTTASIRWGLMLFGSNPTGCGVATVANVPPDVNTAGAIATQLAARANQPGSSTPTRAAETNAAAYLRTLTDANPKVILLATDGQPNCAGNGMGNNAGMADDQPTIDAVAAVAGMGIPSYVIGVGMTGAEATLNSMAMAGGHPQAATPFYYPVASTADLTAALTMIQGMANLPCQFALRGMVTDPKMVSVTIPGITAPTFTLDNGGRGITFTGATCDMLTAGNVTNVAINIGCQQLIP